MGIVGAVRSYCLQSPQDDKIATFLDNNGKIINDDYTYFQQENWFRLQAATLFDPNKFIFLYTNYKQSQQKLNTQWKIVDTKKFKNNEKIVFSDQPLQPKWVFAIRRGVPIKYYKNIIEMLFAKNFNMQLSGKKYQTLFYEYFRKNGNKLQVVTFQEQSIQNTFSTPFLNKQGTEAAKRIAFLISRTHSQLQYNIYVINVITLLLIFVPEADIYDIVSIMIDGSTSMSLQRQQSLRWHFSLTNNQFEKFSKQFFKTVKDISPSIRVINQHLNTEGIDKFEVFKEIVGDFFIGFLPFHLVLQVFIIYLNQGVKIFYRFFYAIMKMAGQVIRQSSSTKQIIRVIRTKLLTTLNNQRQIKQFFRYAFDLQLQNLLIQKAQIQLKKRISKKQFNIVYYLPEIQGESQILSFLDAQIIWGFLPKIIKHYDARKIFSSKDEEASLKSLLTCLQQHSITILIVQTATQQVFGVFMAEKLKSMQQIRESSINKTNSPLGTPSSERKIKHSLSSTALINAKYFGSSQNFVFTLSPNCRKYPSTGQNVYYCSYNEDSFTIGGLQPALLLGTTLTQGFSYNSPTYNNQPLNGSPGQFRIKTIQCFSIE